MINHSFNKHVLNTNSLLDSTLLVGRGDMQKLIKRFLALQR